MSDHDNVVRFRRPRINIGVVIFVLIFIFAIIQIIRSLNQTHVSIYEVKKSYIDTNISGEAVALRQEKLIPAESTGYINYYIRGGQKVGNQAVVYTIDSTGSLSDLLIDMSNNGTTLNAKGYNEIHNSMAAFDNSFSKVRFSDVYQFKSGMQSDILDIASGQILEEISAGNLADTAFSSIVSPESGVVCFYQDGFEDKTPDSLVAADFDQTAYQKTPLKTGEIVQAGAPVYKLITSEYWNLVLPISDEDAERLKEDDRATLRLPNVPHDVYADLALMEKEGKYYANLSLDKRMVNYCDDRFVHVEIVMTKSEGLNIPNTAMLEKEIIKIPKNYATIGGDEDNQTIGFFLRTLNENGEVVNSLINPPIVDTDEEFYYVNKVDFAEDAVLVVQDSQEAKSINDFGRITRTGVYCVNRGVTEFTVVEPLETDGEFTIVEDHVSYSLSQFDRIILDASTVEENQIIN